MAPDLHSFHGGCSCPAVSFSVRASPEVALCHCETCRRCSGGIGMGWINGDRPVGCLGPCRPSGVRLPVRASTDSFGSRPCENAIWMSIARNRGVTGAIRPAWSHSGPQFAAIHSLASEAG